MIPFLLTFNNEPSRSVHSHTLKFVNDILVRNNWNENYKNFKNNEIIYKGKNVSLGYAHNYKDLGKGDKNKQILKTGDLGKKDKDGFFLDSFERIAGNGLLRKQIKQGWNSNQIRASWEPKLSQFKKKRKQYLLYPDE